MGFHLVDPPLSALAALPESLLHDRPWLLSPLIIPPLFTGSLSIDIRSPLFRKYATKHETQPSIVAPTLGGRVGGQNERKREVLWTDDGWRTDMVALEIAILAGLGLLNLAAIGFLAHWIRMHLDQGLQDIDEKLAIAITALIDKLMSGNLGEFEPPNPIQGAIAQLIQGMAQQKMNTINATVTERSPDGQFAPAQSFE